MHGLFLCRMVNLPVSVGRTRHPFGVRASARGAMRGLFLCRVVNLPASVGRSRYPFGVRASSQGIDLTIPCCSNEP
jgi:hypothetical protein